MTILDRNRSPVSLTLYSPAQQGLSSGCLMDVTSKLQRSWRRSIRSVGGYWVGQADYDGAPEEMLDLFRNGMGYDIRENYGGITTWEGFLAEMELQHNGQVYARSWSNVNNTVKCVYSKIGKNLIDYPYCETRLWDAYGTPTVRELSTTWCTQGSRSCHVVADGVDDGVIIDGSITIVANEAYQARITINLVSGIWRFEIYDSSGNSVDSTETDRVGQSILYTNISNDDVVTSVGLRLYCVDEGGGEIYADAAVFQLAPCRAETSWYANAQSQAEYGRKELILLQAGMTDEAANSLAEKTMNEQSWARADPPPTMVSNPGVEDSLHLVFLGYVYTLSNRYLTQIGIEDKASALISEILADAEYIQTGLISPNDLSYYIEDIEAYRAWHAIEDIVEAGDAGGNRWECGVYNDRKLYYQQSSLIPVARIRNGRLLEAGGGMLQGWFAKPGLVALDDIPHPVDYYSPTAQPKGSAWADEVEFNLGKYLAGEDGVTFRRNIL